MGLLLRGVFVAFVLSLLLKDGVASNENRNRISSATVRAPKVINQILSLEQRIQFIIKERNYSPLAGGQEHVMQHPDYESLVFFADQLGVKISWVDSIAESVLALPHEQDRMKVRLEDKFQGWFEEYTHPNIIFLDRKTSLSTLVHELRHAIHLGTYGTRMGTPLDRSIQRSKAEALIFRERIEGSPLPINRIKHLRKLSIEYIETASEILAYSDEYTVAAAFQDQAEMDSAILGRNRYWRKLHRIYKALKADPVSQNETFVESLMESMSASSAI